MAFKSAVVVTAPDADPKEHRAFIKTPMYELTVVAVKHGDLDQAAAVCRGLVKDEGVRSIILCPAFSHQGVARIADAVGEDVAINISRGDTRGSMIARQALKEAGWI